MKYVVLAEDVVEDVSAEDIAVVFGSAIDMMLLQRSGLKKVAIMEGTEDAVIIQPVE